MIKRMRIGLIRHEGGAAVALVGLCFGLTKMRMHDVIGKLLASEMQNGFFRLCRWVT
jgi:hypothetical protein